MWEGLFEPFGFFFFFFFFFLLFLTIFFSLNKIKIITVKKQWKIEPNETFSHFSGLIRWCLCMILSSTVASKGYFFYYSILFVYFLSS